MKLVVLCALFFYAIERMLETFRKRKKIEGMIVAPYTLYLLIGSHLIVFVVTMFGWMTWKDDLYSRSQFANGLISVTLSVVGRSWSIRTLGLYHSIHIEIRRPHPLTISGPYRFVRNPYYLSNALKVLGLPLIAASWPGILAAIVFYWPVLWLRMVLEQRALEKANAKASVGCPVSRSKIYARAPSITYNR